MIRLLRIALIALLLLVGLAACQNEQAVPTLLDANVPATEAAMTAAALTPTATNTRVGPTLPPTWTPTDEVPPTPTTPAVVPTETPPGYSADGTLFYIYNGDSIATVKGDGTGNQIIETFGVGQTLSDLALSPDGQLLAYVGPVGPDRREVFVDNRDGTYRQKVSCLNFPDVRQPTWTPDGRALVFFAAPQVGGPFDLYIAEFAGANACPGNQSILTTIGSNIVQNITFSPKGERLFYSAGAVYVYFVGRGEQSVQYTVPSGIGADFALAHSPLNDRLFYLRMQRDPATGRDGGALVQILDSSVVPSEPIAPPGAPYFATGLVWSREGKAVLITSKDTIWYLDPDRGTTKIVVDGLPASPIVAFSPNPDKLAYTDYGPGTEVQQIYVYHRSRGTSTQLTNNPEGTISDLVWAEG